MVRVYSVLNTGVILILLIQCIRITFQNNLKEVMYVFSTLMQQLILKPGFCIVVRLLN